MRIPAAASDTLKAAPSFFTRVRDLPAEHRLPELFEFQIRSARPEEAESLSALALRSKAYWGYSADFMQACREELTLTAAYVQKNPTFVAEQNREVVGFGSLERLSATRVELGYLFIDPAAIGCGFGRQLMEFAKQEACKLGYTSMTVQGDPNAESFYRVSGGVLVGTRESMSVAGRQLPLFEFDPALAKPYRR